MTKVNAYYMVAVIEIAESLGWNVDYGDEYVTFQQYSSVGQDYSVTIDLTENFVDFRQSVYDQYEDYDPSEEASLWLDDTGHGKNGAPYRMIDVYNDMVECESMLGELAEALYNSNIPDTVEDMEVE